MAASNPIKNSLSYKSCHLSYHAECLTGRGTPDYKGAWSCPLCQYHNAAIKHEAALIKDFRWRKAIETCSEAQTETIQTTHNSSISYSVEALVSLEYSFSLWASRKRTNAEDGPEAGLRKTQWDSLFSSLLCSSEQHVRVQDSAGDSQ